MRSLHSLSIAPKPFRFNRRSAGRSAAVISLPSMEMERPEIVELFYSALINPNDIEQLSGFLGPRVEWISLGS